MLNQLNNNFLVNQNSLKISSFKDMVNVNSKVNECYNPSKRNKHLNTKNNPKGGDSTGDDLTKYFTQ